MSPSYGEEREWSDLTLRLAIEKLAERGVPTEVASHELDVGECTDLIGPNCTRIAVRLRRSTNERYRDRVTVRSHVPLIDRTEVDKMLEHPPTLVFTGVVDHDGTSLAHWRIVDGRALSSLLRTSRPPEVTNADGTRFVEVDLTEHPDLVVDGFSDDTLIASQVSRRVRSLLTMRPTS